jgi:hypothetical protein
MAGMVRATLADLKTNTRRVIKPQPPHSCHYIMNGNGNKALCMANPDAYGVPRHPWFVPPRPKSADPYLLSPYGVKGDRLWVREKMRVIACIKLKGRTHTIRVKYEADGAVSGLLLYPDRLKGTPVIGRCLAYGGYKEASRIWLEITGIRVERVQDISENDARAEGCRSADFASGRECILDPKMGSYRLHFQDLWDSINAKRNDGAYSWIKNPWVWVVEFKRLKGENK